jgi:hypothetical protein
MAGCVDIVCRVCFSSYICSLSHTSTHGEEYSVADDLRESGKTSGDGGPEISVTLQSIKNAIFNGIFFKVLVSYF